MIVLLKNFYKLRDYLATDRMKHYEYTYEESHAHHQEPPLSCVVQLDIQAENKN